jgi:hypothetical protein
MIEMKSLNLPRSEETKVEGIETMIEKLGITKAALFIKENLSQKEDYLDLKEKLFGKLTSKDAFKKIKE